MMADKKESIKLLYAGGEDEIVEKKSRFIGYTCPVQTEEEAQEFIEKIKKKNWDARHNCYAYTIGDDHQICRMSDDGEPSQTAGKPMLDLLLGEDIHNMVVVVTRYFGGVLLGTGGLVRAYQQAARKAIESSTVVTKYLGRRMYLHTDYQGIGKIQYIDRQLEVIEVSVHYSDAVDLEVLVKAEHVKSFTEQITEVTNGKAKIDADKEIYFAMIHGRPDISEI